MTCTSSSHRSAEILVRVLVRQVADVDVHGAQVGHVVERVAASMRATPTDGRSNISDESRVKGIDSMARKVSTALSTALSPSHGVDPWAERPLDLQPLRQPQHALGRTPMRRLVGSPVMAKSPQAFLHELVGAAAVHVL